MASIEENFNNVFISDGGRGITVYNRTPDGDRGRKLDTFSHDEYDVHITFRRKPRPFKKGDSVKVMCETTGVYDVIAVHEDPHGWVNNTWAWIHDNGLGAPRSVLVGDLRHTETI